MHRDTVMQVLGLELEQGQLVNTNEPKHRKVLAWISRGHPREHSQAGKALGANATRCNPGIAVRLGVLHHTTNLHMLRSITTDVQARRKLLA